MKYIKPFDIINKYKIGDYILIDLTQLEHDQVHLIKTGEKLPEDYGMTIISDFDESEVYPYSVTFYTGEEDFIKDDEIIRKLTPSEIEKFKTKIEANKYNI